jgi:hypothetical protein
VKRQREGGQKTVLVVDLENGSGGNVEGPKTPQKFLPPCTERLSAATPQSKKYLEMMRKLSDNMAARAKEDADDKDKFVRLERLVLNRQKEKEEIAALLGQGTS